MRTRLAGTTLRAAAAVTVAAAAVLGTAGAAVAAPAADPAPSACRPANQVGTITPDSPSAGHRHYRVLLTAAPGTDGCTLQGSPTGLVFSLNGSPRAVEATPYGDQTTPVELAPGHPVSFDIQVPNQPGGAGANEITFGLNAPGGEIPGEFAAAGGPLEIDAGTQVGPVGPA